MKSVLKRILSVILAVIFLTAQCGFVIAEDGVVAEDGTVTETGAYLEFVRLTTEYQYGEEFYAVIRYHSADGTTRTVNISQCKIHGFDSNVDYTQKQEVVVEYMGVYITCVVTVYAEGDAPLNYEWSFDEEKSELIVSGVGDLPDFGGSVEINEDGTPTEYPEVPWIDYRDRIRTVTVTGNIRTIGAYAFEGCSELRVVNIVSDSIETIRENAFANCHELRYVFIPDTIRYIEIDSFRDCDMLNCIFYGGPMDRWDEYCLSDNIPYGSVYHDFYEPNLIIYDSVTDYFPGEDFYADVWICDMNGTEEPIDSYTVTGFDSYSFGEQEVTITFGPCSTTLPVFVNEVQEPYEVVFENAKTQYGCGEEFYIEVYKHIGGKTVEIPLEECYIEGFDSNCPGRQEVRIRYESGAQCFEYCVMVEVYDAPIIDDEIHWEFDQGSGELMVWAEEMPDYEEFGTPWEDIKPEIRTVTVVARTIGAYAFAHCNNLTKVDILNDNNLIYIGEGAFKYSHRITDIFIPISVEGIGDSAFECGELSNVYYEGEEWQWTNIHIEGGNTPLRRANIYYNSKGISNKEITIICNRSEYKVGDQYFEVEVYEIDENGVERPIMEEEYQVEGFDTSEPGEYEVTVSYGSYSETFTITVVNRDSLTWSYDSSQKTLEIGGYGEMGEYDHGWIAGVGGYTYAPWADCLSDVERIIVGDGVTSISPGVFKCCNNLTSVYIGSSVETIGAYAFEYCEKLTELTIPDSVTFISGSAFTNCTSLRNVTFGNGLTEIWGGYNFAHSKLSNVVLPDSLQLLGVGVFYDCAELTEIYIPASVTKIDREVFQKCYALRDVYYGGTESQWNLITIGINNECLDNAVIHFNDNEEPEPPAEPDPPAEPEPELTFEINIENMKTEYYVGEEFEAVVRIDYSDGTSEYVENYEVEGFDSSRVGKYDIVIIYNGIHSIPFTVAVTELTVEPEISPVVTVSTEKCMVGNTVDVVVSLSDNPGFVNLGLEIEYDTALRLVGVSANEAIEAEFTPAESLDVYPYNIIFDSPNNVYYNGNLVTLTFEVPEDAEEGDYFVDISYYKGRDKNYIDGVSVNYDEADNPLRLQYESGMITVYDYTPGDINNDGIVNSKDGTSILRHLAHWNLPNINNYATDVDGDGAVTNMDATLLLRYLAGWNVEIH